MANTGNIATISGNQLTDSSIDLSTKADLVAGLIPSSQLPTISVTGDASGSGTTAITLTLANSGATAGTYGSSTLIPVISVDAKGRVTGVSTVAGSGGGSTTTRVLQTFTTTAGQTVFTVTGGYTVGMIDVFYNGSRLSPSEFTATDGSVITLTLGAYDAGDVIDVIAFVPLTTTTSTPWGQVTGTITSQTDLTSYLSTNYQPLDGDLTAIAALAGTSGLLKKTAANTWSLDTNTYLTSYTEIYQGTVTSVSVTAANGISGTVATAGSTPAITLTLGAITPTSVNGIVFSGSAAPTLSVTGATSVSGTNTGDNAVNSLYSGLVSNATHTGDATGATALTVVGLRGVFLPTLGASAGLLKYTGTGTNTWVFDTSVYLTANQTITLSGAVSGSGTTAITTTLASSVVGITNLSATGTPSSTTYLRGDNTWATVSTGGYTVTTQTANYTETATTGTKIIKGDTTGGTFTITLPTAVGNQALLIIKKTAGTAALVLDGAGTETIDGSLTASLVQINESLTLVSDNANWQIV